MKNKNWIILGGLVAFLLFVSATGAAQNADIDYLGDPNLPRGMRNNNPLNIKYNSGNNWQGKVPFSQNTDFTWIDGEMILMRTFEQFTSYRYGIRAAMKLLVNYMKSGRDTVELIVSKWAPTNSGENNPTSIYIDFVANYIGISSVDYLPLDFNSISNLVIAMARFENGREAVSPAQARQVWEEFFGDGITGVPIRMMAPKHKAKSHLVL